MLICPPLSAYQSLVGAREWIAELDRWVTEYQDDPYALECIARARREAERDVARWLERERSKP